MQEAADLLYAGLNAFAADRPPQHVFEPPTRDEQDDEDAAMAAFFEEAEAAKRARLAAGAQQQPPPAAAAQPPPANAQPQFPMVSRIKNTLFCINRKIIYLLVKIL